MARKTRPKTAHGQRNRTDASVDFYEETHIDTTVAWSSALVDQSTKDPLNPPPAPTYSRSNNQRRAQNLPTDSLQHPSSWSPNPRPFHNTKVAKQNASTKYQPLQMAKDRQRTNGVRATTAPSARQRNKHVSSSETIQDFPTSHSEGYDEIEEVSSDQRALPLRERSHRNDDYMNLPIPRKSNSSTAFEETPAPTRPNHASRSPTKFQAGKVLDLCDGVNSDTEVESSSSNQPAEASSNFTIYSQPSSVSSSDRSMCNSPAPERPAPEAPRGSSSTISTKKDWQPPCIELHDDDDDKPPQVDTPQYMEFVNQIESEPVMLTSTTTPLSQSPSRSRIYQHVESAVASVQKTYSSFFTKVNAPKAKPQDRTLNLLRRCFLHLS
jgi:hypothetical protein